MHGRRAPVTSLTATLTAAAALFIATATTVAPTHPDPDDRGRSVFIDKGCADCHAVYGHGVGGREGRGGPDLGKKAVYGTYLEIAAGLWNHFPKMADKFRRTGKTPPRLTEDEFGGIVTYLSSIRYWGEPGNARAGDRLLKNKGCKSCHRFGGDGGDIGPDLSTVETYLSPLAFAAAMWNHGPAMMERLVEEAVEPPVFKAHEIVDVAAAVRASMTPTNTGVDPYGDAEKGLQVARQKGCVHCHSGDGTAGGSAPDFEEMEFQVSVTEIAGDMWNHGPDMWEEMAAEGLDFPHLRVDEMADLVTYLYEMQLQDPPGDRGRGLDVAEDKGCLSCHSEQNGVEAPGPDFSELEAPRSGLELVSRMWNHAPEMASETRDRRRDWPKFTGRELADLNEYLRTVTAASEPG